MGPAAPRIDVERESLMDMIKGDLVAERAAANTCGEMVRDIGDSDPTARSLLKDLLAKEEEHAEDLASLLATLDPTRKVD